MQDQVFILNNFQLYFEVQIGEMNKTREESRQGPQTAMLTERLTLKRSIVVRVGNQTRLASTIINSSATSSLNHTSNIASRRHRTEASASKPKRTIKPMCPRDTRPCVINSNHHQARRLLSSLRLSGSIINTVITSSKCSHNNKCNKSSSSSSSSKDRSFQLHTNRVALQKRRISR